MVPTIWGIYDLQQMHSSFPCIAEMIMLVEAA